MRNRRLITLAALAAGLAIMLTGCVMPRITTYRDFPSAALHSASRVQHALPVSYQVTVPESGMAGLLSVFDSAVPSAFRQAGLCPKELLSTLPPQKGTHVVITPTVKHPSARCVVAAFLTGITLTVIPIYCGSGGYHVAFELYVDGEMKKVSRYQITREEIVGLPLLALAWVNFFTYDLKDAIRATIYQFLLDAERDGYLMERGPERCS